MTRRAVVLFARTPEAEARAKGLSARAATLFEALIASWLRAAETAGAVPVIACKPSARQRLSTIAARIPRHYVDQTGVTFGDRLAHAALAVSEFSCVLIAGIDAPPPDLDEAFEALECGDFDAVVASARDGGVNVIGFREAPIELLRSFAIDDRSIAARCFRHFERVVRLGTASDIDSVVRLVSARSESIWRPFRSLLSALIDGAAASPGLATLHAASFSLPARAPPLA